MVYRSSKLFKGFTCAHRKWRHPGHCAYIHGYSRDFTFWFEAHERDENGFVMEFGGLKMVREWLNEQFDHTMLLDADDPEIPKFRDLEAAGACRLITFDDVSCEGTARYVYDNVAPWITEATGGRVWIVSVECRENEKNSAIYIADPPTKAG